jgi:hypothetical protein
MHVHTNHHNEGSKNGNIPHKRRVATVWNREGMQEAWPHQLRHSKRKWCVHTHSWQPCTPTPHGTQPTADQVLWGGEQVTLERSVEATGMGATLITPATNTHTHTHTPTLTQSHIFTHTAHTHTHMHIHTQACKHTHTTHTHARALRQTQHKLQTCNSKRCTAGRQTQATERPIPHDTSSQV